jgi:hypothetical protein
MLKYAHIQRCALENVQQPRVLFGNYNVLVTLALKNVSRIEDDSDMLLVLQVANTSRGSSGPSSNRGGGNVENATTSHVSISGWSEPVHLKSTREAREVRWGSASTCPTRGECLPEGYTFIVRTPATPTIAPKFMETVDLTTPPDAAFHMSMEDLDTSKRKAAERRNVTRSSNKQAHASFTKEAR